MHVPRSFATATFAAALACAAPAAAAPADGKTVDGKTVDGRTVDLPKLQALAAGLEDVGDKKNSVKFIRHGAYDYEVYFQPYDKGGTVAIYMPFGKVAADALAKAPTAKMLEFNDVRGLSLALYDDDGTRTLYMQHRLPAALATPQGLRADIDAVVAAAEESVDLWDQDKWGAAGDAKPAPLTLSNVMFVSQPSGGYGMWKKRPTDVFMPGDKLLTYAEMHGFDYKPEGDAFGFSADVAIRTAKGDTVFTKADLGRASMPSHVKNKEFNLDLSMEVKGLEPGDYVLSYVVHDINSDHTVTTEQPFVIKTQSAAK